MLALVSGFLPVPMAFDVAITYVALTRSVPLPYVVIILCTLGIVSVYSLSIVGKSISWKVATAAYATVAALGAAAVFSLALSPNPPNHRLSCRSDRGAITSQPPALL